MKTFAILGFLALAAAPALPVLAMDDMAMHGSMAMGGSMAKCAAANPAVIVNTSKMTYMMDTKANRISMKGMMDHDKFVCRSTATKMGAHMKSGGSMMMPPHGKM